MALVVVGSTPTDGEQLLCRETADPIVALRRISPLLWPPLIPSLPPEGGPCQD